MLFHLVPLHEWATTRTQELSQSGKSCNGSKRVRIQPWVRVVTSVMMVFAIALIPIGHWQSLACYGVGILAVINRIRLPWKPLIQRLGIELSFALALLLGMLWRQEGSAVWSWGWLRLTDTGLTMFGTVAIKVLLSLLILNLLTLTTTASELLKALALLRCPPLLVAILASMQRYLTGLLLEFQGMQRAAQSRNLLGTRSRHRKVVGNTIGSLFIRTYDRGERIHQAMLARGYRGVQPIRERLKLSRSDAGFLGATVALIAFAAWLGG